jgi:hypothetical protein
MNQVRKIKSCIRKTIATGRLIALMFNERGIREIRVLELSNN